MLGRNLVHIKHFFAFGDGKFNDLVQCEDDSFHLVELISTNDHIIGRKNVYNYELNLQLPVSAQTLMVKVPKSQ